MHTPRFLLLACLAFLPATACSPEPAEPRPPLMPLTPPVACATASAPVADEPHPALRLPTDVHPVAEAIELAIRPEQARFVGRVDLDVQLDRPRASLWLHARQLHFTVATVTPDGLPPIAAAWGDEDEHGLGRLRLASAAPAGHAKVHLEYDAAFVAGNTGLFKVTAGGAPYAFTQFEATDARRAFPCFDEPSFKIPFTVTLDVADGQTVIANTPETKREPTGGGLVSVHFATTRPLPSYLVAFAVGPLDVVKAPDVLPNAVRSRPLPLRGIATKGRGSEMAYALAHAGDFLSALEAYFGIEYPYEKMDVLAVPGMGGAMENAGAVTFAESLLLFDPRTAPLSQRLDYAGTMAHEFAHQWFGNLVTMAWWDDTWLNESFAEWMGYKIAEQWDPSLHADLGLAAETQRAIGNDSLVSVRQIHQPIASADDIDDAFDDATYQKGGSVIAMFERWLGPEVFRKGVRQHLTEHRYGVATVDDFLHALSAAAARDMTTPYRTFLDQPGVPLVEASLQCGTGAPHVHLVQSRFLPMGSTGDTHALWQIPVCAKYPVGSGTKESCTLLTAAEGELPLESATCPDWVFPNAHGTGYYRFVLAPADLVRLRTAGLKALDTREKMAFGNSLRGGFNHGSTHFEEAMLAAAPLVDDADPRVAGEPEGFVEMAHEWLRTDAVHPRIEAYARRLAAGSFARLGWTGKKGEEPSAVERRRAALQFLVSTGRDPALRAEARRRGLAYLGLEKGGGLHREALDENLVGVALWVVGEEADAATWDAMLERLVKTDDNLLRGRLIGALSSARDPQLAARARALVLDDRLRYSEMLSPLWTQVGQPETREAAWTWLKEHWDAVAARASAVGFGGMALASLPADFCDEDHEHDVAAFLGERAKKLAGGPRVLVQTVEGIHLCTVKRQAEEGNARAFFLKH